MNSIPMHDKFTPADFKCKCGKCGLGYANMDEAVIKLLFGMRDTVQRPMIIKSAARCPEHNKKVGGSLASAHMPTKTNEGLVCWALDVAYADSKMLHAMIKYLNDNNIRRYGINFKLNFVHWDTAPHLPQDVCFEY